MFKVISIYSASQRAQQKESDIGKLSTTISKAEDNGDAGIGFPGVKSGYIRHPCWT